MQKQKELQHVPQPLYPSSRDGVISSRGSRLTEIYYILKTGCLIPPPIFTIEITPPPLPNSSAGGITSFHQWGPIGEALGGPLGGPMELHRGTELLCSLRGAHVCKDLCTPRPMPLTLASVHDNDFLETQWARSFYSSQRFAEYGRNLRNIHLKTFKKDPPQTDSDRGGSSANFSGGHFPMLTEKLTEKARGKILRPAVTGTPHGAEIRVTPLIL